MKFFRITWNEIKKEMLTTFSYKFQWVGEFLSLAIFYFFLSKLSNRLEFSAFSYCLWFYSMLIVGDISGKISTEMKLGTFEQVYFATYPIPIMLLAKMLASIVRSGLLMICLLLLLINNGSFDVLQFLNVNIYLSVFFITPGLFGIGLLIGGLTLLLKDAGWMLNIINNCMLFLSGIFISTDVFPYWIQKIAVIIPTTQAIQLIKQENVYLMNWVALSLISLAYLALGGLVFFFCSKKAKSQGLLAHY